ncbi:MAG: Arm DNA-binding domain-containing protein, partial [Guyparkeria sp.]
MGKIRVREETNRLYFDFRYKGVRCREYTALTDTPANR